MPDLTFDQMIYLRNLQYTFELAMSAYVVACQNEETLRLAAKFMDDMHLLASEMYAISRRLNLAMQVRFPRECDDPILTANQPKQKAMRKGGKKEPPETGETGSGCSAWWRAVRFCSEGENLCDYTGEYM